MRKYIAIGFVAVSVPVLSWLLMFYDSQWSPNSSDWSNFGCFIGGTLSPILAFASFLAILVTIKLQQAKNNQEKRLVNSAIYCEHAVKCLERAYNILSNDDESKTPIKDRLVWLTCARLILKSKQLYALISNEAESQKTLFDSEEEFWRHRFYELLDFTGMQSFSMSKDYFEKASLIPGDEIEERSIKVIYDFALKFNEDSDPINQISKFEKSELGIFHFSQSGLKDYLMDKFNRRVSRK
jgi:hypothetical protein